MENTYKYPNATQWRFYSICAYCIMNGEPVGDNNTVDHPYKKKRHIGVIWMMCGWRYFLRQTFYLYCIKMKGEKQ